MKQNKIILIFAFLVACVHLNAQHFVEPLNYRSRIELSEIYLTDSMELHSGVLPLIHFSNKGLPFQKTQLLFTNKTRTVYSENDLNFRVYPLADIGAGFESGLSIGSPLKYSAGAGAGFDLARKNFSSQQNFFLIFQVVIMYLTHYRKIFQWMPAQPDR